MDKLKAFLKRSKMSQYRLAKELGCDRSAVTHWIKGTRKVSRKHVVQLSHITGIPIENLL